MRSDETKDRDIQGYLEAPSKYNILVQVEARQRERGLQFNQTRSHAVALYNTLFAACIEKALCMKSTGELYQIVRSALRVPRIVFKIELETWSTRSTK